MPTPVERELLDSMLAGDRLDETDLRALMALPREGQYHEFKGGEEMDNRKKAAHTVRSYVSGFANADGGLLIIGVSDGDDGASPRKVTPMTRPGKETLDGWALTTLDSVRGFLVPTPRFQVLPVEGQEVLIIATARAPSLVPCLENGRITYFLRIGDSTAEVPAYLMSDLLLGRRAHPALEVRKHSKGGAVNGVAGQGSWQVGFGFHIENVGFTPADAVRVGVIAWAMNPRGRDSGVLVSENLRRFIDVPPDRPPDIFGAPAVLVHVMPRGDKMPDIPPFEARTLGLGDLLLPQENGMPMRSALYVIARGHPPDWYQLDWLVPSQFGDTIEVQLTRQVGQSPIVAWNQEWRGSEAAG